MAYGAQYQTYLLLKVELSPNQEVIVIILLLHPVRLMCVLEVRLLSILLSQAAAALVIQMVRQAQVRVGGYISLRYLCPQGHIVLSLALVALEQVRGITGHVGIMGQTLQVLAIPQLAVAVADQRAHRRRGLLGGQEVAVCVEALVVQGLRGKGLLGVVTLLMALLIMEAAVAVVLGLLGQMVVRRVRVSAALVCNTPSFQHLALPAGLQAVAVAVTTTTIAAVLVLSAVLAVAVAVALSLAVRNETVQQIQAVAVEDTDKPLMLVALAVRAS